MDLLELFPYFPEEPAEDEFFGWVCQDVWFGSNDPQDAYDELKFRWQMLSYSTFRPEPFPDKEMNLVTLSRMVHAYAKLLRLRWEYNRGKYV